jgi:hypothetical protein
MKRTSGQRQDVPYLSREDIEAEAALVLKLLLREASDDRLAREVLADPYAKTRVNSPMDRSVWCSGVAPVPSSALTPRSARSWPS